jgi:hypothetical protein
MEFTLVELGFKLNAYSHPLFLCGLWGLAVLALEPLQLIVEG